MKSTAVLATLFLLLALTGCHPSPPPPTARFVYTPPTTEPVRSDMAIGILKTVCAGNVPLDVYYKDPKTNVYIRKPYADLRQLLSSAQTDLARMLVAKGFPTTDVYSTIDEMTFTEKQRATLVLSSTFEIIMTANPPASYDQKQTATVSGTATIDMVDPVTREKIWVKRLPLDPITIDEPERTPTLADLLGTGVPRYRVVGIDTEAMTILLNKFYDQTMPKLWNHLDPREIAALKGQVMAIRKNSTHIAK